jgi:HSP90 family molecular chaperone
MKTLARGYNKSAKLYEKKVDEVDIDSLEADLDRLQKEMQQNSENAKRAAAAEPDANKSEEEQLAELFKQQQSQMTGDDDIIGEGASAPSDVLIEETEKVAGPSSSMEFQAETRKLLDIVARSLYSDKEVFVRELISNSSDALEKTRFKRQGGEGTATGEGELKIMISADEVKKTLTIQDSGIGMTKEELISDLGRIGHSGTGEYLKAMEQASTGNLIGQFGVGFYATFMVAQRIRVYSRSLKKPEEPGYLWESDGAGSYTIAEAEGVAYGTKIVIDLLPTCEEFSKKQTIESIIKKYSNFVGFPIYLNGAKINMVRALWLLPPGEVSAADHKEFYQFISHAHDSPLYHLHYNADSPINIRSVFYVPETHMEKYGLGVLEPGVSLYTRKVLIQAKCKGLLPDWLRFIKGVVDSEDIPLNLSRELLQDSGLIKRLQNVLTRRILKYFDDQSREDEVKYLKFYNEYAQFLKQGICTDLKWKEDLAKLLRMESSKTQENVNTTLEKYVADMHPSQTEIYYLCIPSRSYAESSPYFETFQKRGVEVLFLYHSIDDFVMSNLAEYKGKKLVSIESQNASDSIKDINPENVEDKKPENENLGDLKGEKFTSFATWMKDVLSTRVTTVVETTRLSSSPAVVIDHESASFRRMMKMVDPTRAPTQPKVQLQINPAHPVILRLNQVREVDSLLARDVAEQIMDNAMIQAGLLDDNRSMVPRITKLLDRALQHKL